MFQIRLALVLVGIAASSNPPDVDVAGLGSVRGVFMLATCGNVSTKPTNISAFLGIPFAKSPIGDLRWRAPQPRGVWTSKPLDATKFGNCCMQTWPTYLPPNKSALSEDCLHLNVYSPTAALNGKQKLPVMFWIHGGAYTTGCSDDYPGSGLVNTANLGMVVVTTNYRLNVFGFLGAADLKPRTTDGSVGNYGIQDQRFAMQWVVDHISAFGGDASGMTIFGESAGGSSVINHLTQTASFHLYKKAIIESGTYLAETTLGVSGALYDTVKLATRCKDLECLLNTSAEKLTKDTELEQLWGPTVDGPSLSDTPWNLIRQGKYNSKVPIMLGGNRDEAAMFELITPLDKAFPPTMGEAEVDVILAGLVGPAKVQKVKQLYDPSNYKYPSDLGNYSQAWWQITRILTDLVPFLGACGARNFSQSFHKGGSPSVFTYLFAHPTQFKGFLPGSGPGAVLVPHGSEIIFVLAGLDQLTPGEESQLSIQMAQYWINFAITGNPNGGNLPKWPQYGVEGDVVLRLQATSEGGITAQHGLRKEQCDFWDAHPSPISLPPPVGVSWPGVAPATVVV